MSEELNVFKLKKAENFNELLMHIKLISNEIYKWIEKIKHINRFVNFDMTLIDKDNTKDAFHNISQNIIELSKLIQKKIQE